MATMPGGSGGSAARAARSSIATCMVIGVSGLRSSCAATERNSSRARSASRSSAIVR
jgi:hypothetical protein